MKNVTISTSFEALIYCMGSRRILAGVSRSQVNGVFKNRRGLFILKHSLNFSSLLLPTPLHRREGDRGQ